MKKQTNEALINIPVYRIHPHPDNPRKNIGDVTELTKSIKTNGIMQNLTVIPMDDEPGEALQYMVLIGHRRLVASKIAGLEEVPCRVIEGLTKREQLSIMLEENMQRTDLTIYEQAEGFQMMLDLGETMETIKEKTGFSETTIRHRLNIAKLDKKQLKKAEECFQISIKDLSLLEGIKNIKTRNRILSECSDHRDFAWKTNQAITEEKRDAAEKELLKLLEPFNVEKAPEGFSAYGANVVRVKTFSLDQKLPKKTFKWDITPPKDEKLMYRRSFGDLLIMYQGKPPKEKKTPQQEKEDQINRNRKKVKAIMKNFAADRRNFLIDVADGKYEKAEDPEAIIKDCYAILLQMNTTIGYNELAGYLSQKHYWDLKEDERQGFIQKAKALSMEHSLLMLLDYRVGDDVVTMDYNGHFKDRGEGYALSYLRKFLDILSRYGFQIDDKYAPILDGTSELYTPRKN